MYYIISGSLGNIGKPLPGLCHSELLQIDINQDRVGAFAIRGLELHLLLQVSFAE